jgi:large subunit ribosomal protein L14
MVMIGTKLKVVDNTGAKTARCIKVLGTNYREGWIGDQLIVAIQRIRWRKLAKKHEIYKAVLVGHRKKKLRSNGMWISFIKNCIILVDQRKNPIGSRIFGSIPIELRRYKYGKLLSMAQSIV